MFKNINIYREVSLFVNVLYVFTLCVKIHAKYMIAYTYYTIYLYNIQ